MKDHGQVHELVDTIQVEERESRTQEKKDWKE